MSIDAPSIERRLSTRVATPVRSRFATPSDNQEFPGRQASPQTRYRRVRSPFGSSHRNFPGGGCAKYDPYGKVTVLEPDGVTVRNGSAYGNQIGFTGRRLDAETGLMYYRARMYSGELGRFVSRDPWMRHGLSQASRHPATETSPSLGSHAVFDQLVISKYGPRFLVELKAFGPYEENVQRLEGQQRALAINGSFAPSALDGYPNGMNSYAAYFIPNGLDASGEKIVTAACCTYCACALGIELTELSWGIIKSNLNGLKGGGYAACVCCGIALFTIL